MTIKILVTRDRYEEVVSIDDDMNFFDLTNREAYKYMLQFVVNDKDEYMDTAEARKLFKTIPRKELAKYFADFVKAVGEAFVSKANGADLDEQSSPE